MELNWLDSEAQPVSSVKEAQKKVVDIKYDPAKADLTQQSKFDYVGVGSGTPPYVARAIKKAKDQGYKVVLGIKEALIGRANGEKVLSLREADIMLRTGISFENEFVSTAFSVFGGMLAEDDCCLTNGTFALRQRWNKGVEWRNTKRMKCEPAQQNIGDLRLTQIKEALVDIGLPLHREEEINGFDPEFLKPEYLTYEQTTYLLNEAAKYRNQNQKQETAT